MTSGNYKFKGQFGVTLVELLIVIVIIVTVSTFALVQLGSSKQKFTRQEIAGLFKVALERARFDSVKRRAIGTNEQANVEVNTTEFTSKTDVNRNGTTTDAADAIETNFSGESITLSVNGGTLPTTIYFNKRGEVVNAAGVSISPVFFVCNGTCNDTNDTSSNATILLVTPTGTVNLLAGGSSVPDFDPPDSTWAGSSDSEINENVVIP